MWVPRGGGYAGTGAVEDGSGAPRRPRRVVGPPVRARLLVLLGGEGTAPGPTWNRTWNFRRFVNWTTHLTPLQRYGFIVRIYPIGA